MSHFNFNFKRNWERSKLCSQISSQKKGKQFFPLQSQRPDYSFFAFSFPLLFPPPLLLLNPIPLTRYYVERENVSNSPWTTVQKQTHLNKPWDVLGWIFPFPLLDGGPVGGWGSLADRWTKAGALLLFDSPTEVGPAIISMLELSLDELSVCWSSVRINLMFSPIECSNEDTCRDSWSILAFISSTGRPGPLWKSPRSEKREGGEKKRKKKRRKRIKRIKSVPSTPSEKIFLIRYIEYPPHFRISFFPFDFLVFSPTFHFRHAHFFIPPSSRFLFTNCPRFVNDRVASRRV